MTSPPPPYRPDHPSRAWHAESAAVAAAESGVVPSAGLTASEAQERLIEHGANQIAGTPPRPAWRKFLDQFKNFLVIVLLGAAVLAGAVGDLKDAIVIAVVVVLNATLGFYQEHRAEAALAALKDMLAPEARVRRDGRSELIPAADLVPGDILLLEAGDRIPADARVLHAHAAEVAEAALTGESHPVTKTPEAVAEKSALAERRSMTYMNTVVTRGRIEAVVTATGMHTEMGRLAGLLAETAESATPLQLQLDRLGKRLAAIAGVVVTLIFALGVARGDDLVQTAMTAIALAVAAIPEGLPAVVTVTLALGMHRMAKRHAIVKKLAAVETLGCTTVICSDKTGTLTLNQMTARRLFTMGRRFTASGEGYAGSGAIAAEDGQPLPEWQPLLTAAALCADSRIRDGELIGDPTEGALLALAAKAGLATETLAEHNPRIAEIPFDSAHKFMATFHHDGAVVRMWLKGAPDVLLARASRQRTATGDAALDDTARDGFAAENAAYAEQAMRVLALAGREIPAADFDPAADLMHWAVDLTLIALVGIIDPARPEARDAIRVCQAAGIAVKMITGDHRATAAAIARDLGLVGEVREGSEIEAIEGAALAEMVESTAVFARVAPEHKMRIVEALKARGHVVAMTGDGVNDAPALKTADIGVAMGITGTEVTKEAATLVLTDDNFASIVHAVEEGRTIYDNIVKFVRFQLSTNIGAILTVLGAPLFGMPTPFTAIQILWVNIIMDGPPAMTLGVEPARPGIMHGKPRAPDAHILTGSRLWRLALYGLTMAAGTLAAYAWGARQGGHVYAVTLSFTTFVLFQFFNIFNARYETGTAFNRQFFANDKLWLALAGVVMMQVAAVHWGPAQKIFDTVDLSLGDWLLSAAIASTVLLLEEGRKLLLVLLKRKRRQSRHAG
ncbi:MAG: HAD-IC family P-type ATPase [Gammaproteobacteria bacterium]|nr:HAD-IC family P-type ATPase [Gammaproteobacteria bacterium]MBU1647652.1 HAD-IC family P-type ATPase [Gammaproteobacteria bacterium]MBU1973509.1 HAD-IC family P-type ATPase [Gammaproteobacteria bacterium]